MSVEYSLLTAVCLAIGLALMGAIGQALDALVAGLAANGLFLS
jgi:hypothetical protein